MKITDIKLIILEDPDQPQGYFNLRLVPDLPRLRISSIDSIEADPALIDAIGSEPRLMPHLHLSLQAGDDMILKRMKRRHLRDDAIRFCEEIRARRPEMVFGADIIAGFPTETEAMFENSLRLIEECGGPRGVLEAASGQPARLGLEPATLKALLTPNVQRLEADLAWLELPSRALVTWEDALYPGLLRRIASPPAAVFVEGNIDALWRPQLAIIGSRNPTAGGLEGMVCHPGSGAASGPIRPGRHRRRQLGADASPGIHGGGSAAGSHRVSDGAGQGSGGRVRTVIGSEHSFRPGEQLRHVRPALLLSQRRGSGPGPGDPDQSHPGKREFLRHRADKTDNLRGEHATARQRCGDGGVGGLHAHGDRLRPHPSRAPLPDVGRGARAARRHGRLERVGG